MRDTNYLVVYIFANVVYIYTIYKFMGIFFERLKVTNKVLFLAYVLAYIINTSAYILDGRPIINILNNIIILISLTLLYDSTPLKRGIAVFFTYFFLFFIEFTVAFITAKMWFSLYETSEYSSIFGMVSVRIITYILVILIQNFQHTKNVLAIEKRYWIFVSLIPVTSFYLFFNIYQYGIFDYKNFSTISIIFLMINFIALYLFDQINMSFQIRLQNELYKLQANAAMKQLEIITNSEQQIKEIKHDLNNHIAVLQNYLETDDTDKIKKYIQNMFKMVGERCWIVNTGNLAIDSILNYKIGIAQDIGIEIKCEININGEVKVLDTDIVTLLGNLVDNAIQATSKERDLSEKTVIVYIAYEKGMMKIRTENICNDGSIDLKSLGTSKIGKGDHGIGLRNVRKVVEKYNGELDISRSGQNFIVDLILMSQS